MKVILVEPNRFPRRLEIPNQLHVLQDLVGGHIEHVGINGRMGMLVNEEGKFMGLKKNFKFRGDTIVGNAVFIGYDGEDFADVPACPADIRTFIAREESSQEV